MKSDLKPTTLRDKLELAYGTALTKQDRLDGPYPVFGSNGIIGYHNKYLVKGPGIIIGRKGSLGAVSFSEQNFWPIDTAFYVKLKKGNDIRFWYYLLKTLKLQTMDSHSAVPGLSRDVAYNLQCFVPPLDEQRKIASFLVAFDDLIEKNLRRIKILEEMAQNLYREWFVKFRFPGHEEADMINSSSGLMPSGWEMKKIADLCSKLVDGTHDSQKPVEEGYCLVLGRHIINGFIDYSKCYKISTEEHEKIMRRSKPEKGDIILSNRGTIGTTALVDVDFEFSIQNVALFKPLKPIYSTYLFVLLSSKDVLESMIRDSYGTAQKLLSLVILRKMKVLSPPDHVISMFDQIVRPILKLRSVLNKQKTSLEAVRDYLLPKLISGEVDVSELKITIPKEENA
jgi:type I restriction enzyme, S subunit